MDFTSAKKTNNTDEFINKFNQNSISNEFRHAIGVGTGLDMEYQNAAALDQRNWEENMANTAHQREVADLQAAGLNPVLSANSGADMGNATGQNASSQKAEAAAMLQAALNAKLIQAQTKQINSNIRNNIRKTKAEVRNLNSNSVHKEAVTAKLLKLIK